MYRILAVSVFSLCSCRDTRPAFDCTPPSHLGTRGSALCTGRGGEREREREGEEERVGMRSRERQGVGKGERADD